MRISRGLLVGVVVAYGLWSAAVGDESKAPKLSAEEQTIFDLTNEARARKKLPPLKVNALLMKAAANHSANMAKQDQLEHELDGKDVGGRLDALGYAWEECGENIALHKQAAGAFAEWMQSDGHRGNILDPKCTEIGIGIAQHPKKKLRYFTQVFGLPGKGAKPREGK